MTLKPIKKASAWERFLRVHPAYTSTRPIDGSERDEDWAAFVAELRRDGWVVVP
jgi:hypothetical protein